MYVYMHAYLSLSQRVMEDIQLSILLCIVLLSAIKEVSFVISFAVDMTSALQQVGKDLGRIARGEESVSSSVVAQQKRSTGQGVALYSQGIHRTAAELEENSGQANFSWGWQPENKE